MIISPEKFIAARKVSDMTLSTAAELAKITSQTYIAREKHPEQFRVCELKGVYDGLTETGKSLFRDGMSEIFREDREGQGHEPVPSGEGSGDNPDRHL